jgi:hypothetical protein
MADQLTQKSKKNKSLARIIFIASTIALAVAIITHWEWLTLILPFWTTSFVVAMDLM